MNTFTNTVRHKSQLGQIKYSDAYGHFLFRGKTSGLALKYVAKGKEIYYINSQTIEVPEDHFILVRPETHFEATTKKNCNETKGLCIDLSIFFPKIDIKKIIANDLLFNQAFNFSNSTAIGKELNQMGTSFVQNTPSLANKSALLKLGHSVHSFSESIFHFKKALLPLAKKETTRQTIIPKILHAHEYVMSHYKERVSLDQLAREVAISKFQLLKLFKTCFHCSPQEMQSTLRMREAKQLLQKGSLPISEVAFELGYYDLAAFSKKFKNHFGVSPSHFKK